MSRPFKTTHDEPKTTEWHSPREATLQQEKLYGVYVFFLLHHDGSKKQKRKIELWEKYLDGSNLYGRWVHNVPGARETYTKLMLNFKVESQVSGIGGA